MVMVFVAMLMSMAMLVSMAMFAGFFVMVMMVFVYHSSRFIPRAKVRGPECNRVAIVARNG